MWSAALDAIAPAAERAACFLRLTFVPDAADDADDEGGGGGGGASPALVGIAS